MSTITSSVKINSWIFNMSLLTKILWTSSPRLLLDCFLRSLERCWDYATLLPGGQFIWRGSVEIRASSHLFHKYFCIIPFTFLLYLTIDPALVSYFCFILLLWSHLLTWSWDIHWISTHTLLIQTNIHLVYLVLAPHLVMTFTILIIFFPFPFAFVTPSDALTPLWHHHDVTTPPLHMSWCHNSTTMSS